MAPLDSMARVSVRLRLTLWHTLVLGLVLAAFSAETYTYLVELTRRRTDQLLRETARAFVHTFTVEAEENPRLNEAARRAAREFRFSDYRVLVYSANHQLVAVSDSTDVVPGLGVHELTTSPIAPLHRILTPASYGKPTFGTLRLPSREMQAYAVAVSLNRTPFVIATLELRRPETEIFSNYLYSLLISVPLALLLAGLGGYFLASKSLAPVVSMTRQATRINSQNLHERLKVRNYEDEFGRLAAVFNDGLARLEGAFNHQRQFMADASHELRTPIAILRAEADIALSVPNRTSEGYAESLRVIRKEARRMTQIVEDLFTLARADAGDSPLLMEEIYLEELLADCARAVRGLAQARGVELEYRPDREAPFCGDESLLRRLVLNLLDNAIKHSPPGGRVSLGLELSGSRYTVRVRDTGPGIAPEAQEHIFERFFRGDRSRRRVGATATSGAGLGLAISRWVAEAHGGELSLASSGPQGSTFVLILPRPVEAATAPTSQREEVAAPGGAAR